MIILGRAKKKNFSQEVFKYLKFFYEKKKYKIDFDFDFRRKRAYCMVEELLYPLCEEYHDSNILYSRFLEELSNQVLQKMDKAPLALVEIKNGKNCFGIDLREFYNRIDFYRVVRFSLGWMLYLDGKVLLESVKEKGPLTRDTLKSFITVSGFENYLLKDYIKTTRGEYTLDSLADFLLEVVDTEKFDKHLWNRFVVYSPEGVEDYKNLIMNKVKFVSKCVDYYGNKYSFYNFIPLAILDNAEGSVDFCSVESIAGYIAGEENILNLIEQGHVPFGYFNNVSDAKDFHEEKRIAPISAGDTWKTIKPKQVRGKYIEIHEI